MSVEHAIEFEIINSNTQYYCYIKAKGKLTHKDYEVFVPYFEETISSFGEPKVDIIVDITELKGWEIDAAWDDLKFTIKHGKEFNKIAVIGNNTILVIASKVANWFLPYKTKFFSEFEDAKRWIFK